MKKIYYWFIPIIILMAIGTFFDWNISQWQDQVNENFIIRTYYRFFEIFGEFAFSLIPAIIFGFFANFGFRKRKPVIRIIQTGLNSIGLLLFSFLLFISFAHYLQPQGGNSNGAVTPPMQVVSLILGIILALLIFKLMFKISSANYKYFRRVAIMSIVYLITLTIVINSIKVIWARPRYWSVVSGEASFYPWYVINGDHVGTVTNAFKSFPSGHTANAFASLALSLWFTTKRSTVFNLMMVWAILTAVSRIFAGQHYLTDTIMGGLISFSLFLIFYKLFKVDKDVPA